MATQRGTTLTAPAPAPWGSTSIVTSETLPRHYLLTTAPPRALLAGLLLLFVMRARGGAVIRLAAHFESDMIGAGGAGWTGSSPMRTCTTSGSSIPAGAGSSPPAPSLRSAISDETRFDPLPSFAWTVATRARLAQVPKIDLTAIHPDIVWSKQHGFSARWRKRIAHGKTLRLVGGPEVSWTRMHTRDLADRHLRALPGPAGEDHGASEPGVPVGERLARFGARRNHSAQAERIPPAQASAEMGDWAKGQARATHCCQGRAGDFGLDAATFSPSGAICNALSKPCYQPPCPGAVAIARSIASQRMMDLEMPLQCLAAPPLVAELAACSTLGTNERLLVDGTEPAHFEPDLTQRRTLTRQHGQLDAETGAATLFGAGLGAPAGRSASDTSAAEGAIGSAAMGAQGTAEKRRAIVTACMRARSQGRRLNRERNGK